MNPVFICAPVCVSVFVSMWGKGRMSSLISPGESVCGFQSGASGMLRMSSFHGDTGTANWIRMGLHLERSDSVCVYAILQMCVCVFKKRPLYGCWLQHSVETIKSSPVVKSSIPLYLLGLQDNLIITHACTRCLTCLDFQTSSTGMPAMIELGSSWEAEFTVSLAPITMTRSVSDWKHNKLRSDIMSPFTLCL